MCEPQFNEHGLARPDPDERTEPRRLTKPAVMAVSSIVQIIGAVYARRSSTLQSDRSPHDQVRVCRKHAEGEGVVIPDEFLFIEDAISGTKPDREVLEKLRAAAKARKFSVLYVEDLSRLFRESTHLMMLMKELVHEGIRIVSVNEGVDTNNESWKLVATIHGLQHEQYIHDLGHRVRRGQEGAVRDDLSAGDLCLGFTSEPVEGTEDKRRGRNRRPRMRIVIDEVAAHWLVQIFTWFAVLKKSMNWIADELTRREVPKDHRAKTKGWHHTQVKKILTNEKYIGKWAWGRRRNRRNPINGKIRQVAVPPEEVVVRERPDLRIIDQDLWDLTQARLREIKRTYPGPKGAAGNKGSSYVTNYPKHELADLCYCAECNSRLIVAGMNGRYLGCSGRVARRCDVRTFASRAVLRSLLIEQIKEHVLQAEARVDALLLSVQEVVRSQQPIVESTLAARVEEKKRTVNAMQNLVSLAEAGTGELQSIAPRLRQLEQRDAELDAEIRDLEARRIEPVAVPDRNWLLAQLRGIQDWIGEDPAELAHIFRAFTGGRIEMTAIIPPGRKRGHFEARFRGGVLAVVAERAARSKAAKSCKSACLLQRVCRDPAFWNETVLLVGEQDRATELADTVYSLRQSGMTWQDIRARVQCDHTTIHAVYRLGHGRHAA